MRRYVFYFLVVLFCFRGYCGCFGVKYVGGDLSLLPAYESVGTPYYTGSGELIGDVLLYLRDTCKWNAVRCRLFVDPVIINGEDGKRQGEVQDLGYVADFGKRIKEAGMHFMLDFHYSDTWADPVKQSRPRRWESLSGEVLVDTLYGYTKRCLEYLVSVGAEPDFVQVGNETSYGMLWVSGNEKVYPGMGYERYEENWHRLCGYYKACSRAVREVCPESKIVIHIERTEKASQCVNYYDYIGRDLVDYDIIGLSYYPFWHNGFSSLSSTLEALKVSFPNKRVQIVETAWYNAYYPSQSDYESIYDFTSTWPASSGGQKKFLEDLVVELKKHDNVDGVYYWFAEENGNGGSSYDAKKVVIDDWVNRGLWDPSTHRAYPGLEVLKNFYDGDERGGSGSTTLLRGIREERCLQKCLFRGVLVISDGDGFYNVLGERVRIDGE